MNEADGDTLIVNFGSAERERLQFAFTEPDLARSRVLYDDWLEPSVSVQAGPFSGTTRVYISASDFVRFLPQLRNLHDTLQGTATFDTIERQVGFTLTGDGKGHITLAGFLEDRAGGDNRFEFTLSYDQTLLPRSITQMGHLLRATTKTHDA
jgi:hypothetical protein